VIHLDTSFLVDLLREAGRSSPGAATRLLDSLHNEELGISVFVACELFAGAELSRSPAKERSKVKLLCRALQIILPDEGFPAAYGELLARLERRGERLPAMDLLIAAAAIMEEATLVTRDQTDFSRVPDLNLIGY
jgi:tRNA(fMet)-specific endonuclease VapC